MEKQKELTLEETFAQLDNIVQKMESEELTLEESFIVYQKGMKLLKSCSAKIDTVEKKMMQLHENGELSEF